MDFILTLAAFLVFMSSKSLSGRSQGCGYLASAAAVEGTDGHTWPDLAEQM